ncbi:kelch-like protein 40b [Biomphalaria pfeifferi]|uniref:Kelch-like protein 40b n=1 Tax=Biomphalaria pfeifferi TaxID=112525 RepID=A0AAD8F940_BIOPF|nr:kelch-like protein 40b [Biomphalaria pfeifferi]
MNSYFFSTRGQGIGSRSGNARGRGSGVNASIFQQPFDDNISKRNDRQLKISRDVLNCFSQGSNREMFCDFTVVVEEHEFPCHRFLLSACSKFFEALLRSDMKESRQKRVVVKGMSPDIFKLILDVIYCGSDVLTPKTIIEIWNAAHQLQIVFLMSLCEDFIQENLNEANCYEMYSLAQLLSSEKIINLAINFMAKHFYNFAQSGMFEQMKFEDFKKILQFQESTVCVDFKIDTIVNWCCQEYNSNSDGSETDRQKYLGTLFHAVNLSQVSKICLASLMTNKHVLANTEAITAVNRQASQIVINPDYDLVFQQRNGFNLPFPQTSNTCLHCSNKSMKGFR